MDVSDDSKLESVKRRIVLPGGRGGYSERNSRAERKKRKKERR